MIFAYHTYQKFTDIDHLRLSRANPYYIYTYFNYIISFLNRFILSNYFKVEIWGLRFSYSEKLNKSIILLRYKYEAVKRYLYKSTYEFRGILLWNETVNFRAKKKIS